MATSPIEKPLQPVGKVITGYQKSSFVSAIEGTVVQYGQSVHVNMRITIGTSPGNTDSLITGLPRPIYDQNAVIHKDMGASYSCILTGGGTLRNNWSGIGTGVHLFCYSYCTND